jgi:hypothetical protein
MMTEVFFVALFLMLFSDALYFYLSNGLFRLFLTCLERSLLIKQPYAVKIMIFK